MTIFDTLPSHFYKIQTAPVIDAISDDGHVGHRLPYPFYVLPDGSVDGQDFWQGKVTRVAGFQRDLARQQVDLTWDDALADVQKAVGMYLVTFDSAGWLGVHDTAVQSVEVLGK